jgi:hypothetical protein
VVQSEVLLRAAVLAAGHKRRRSWLQRLLLESVPCQSPSLAGVRPLQGPLARVPLGRGGREM